MVPDFEEGIKMKPLTHLPAANGADLPAVGGSGAFSGVKGWGRGVV